jgi:endonuclease/exonuclease/phosphatase family metal-dependent hydrolase
VKVLEQAPAGRRALFARALPGLVEFGLPALTIVFGMQTLRTLLPLLVYLLRDRLGWTAVELGLYALALFSLGFLAAPLWRVLGVRRVLIMTAGGMGVLRFLMQLANVPLWKLDPVATLVLASAATVCFIVFVPTWLLAVRPGGPTATARYGVSVLLGFVLDLMVHGAVATWDLVWRPQSWAVGVVAVSVAAQLALLVVWVRSTRSVGTPEGVGLPALVLGPMVALQLLVFGNPARVAAAVGDLGQAVYVTGIVAMIGVVVVLALQGFEARLRWWPRSARALRDRRVVVGLGCVLAVSVVVPAGGWLSVYASLLSGQVALACLVASSFIAAGAPGKGGAGRVSAASAAGMLVLVVIVFLTYAGYDIALPVPAAWLPVVAAVAIMIGALARPSEGLTDPLVGRWDQPTTNVFNSAVFAVVIGWTMLVQFGVGSGLPGDLSATPPQALVQVRVMTFNLHNGFDTTGWLGMEALARTIEQQHPDVVALQEVARGWVIDGSTDMLGWLSQRLQMDYVFDPTAGPLWGNAVLTRLPIKGSRTYPLPTPDLLIGRGYVRVLLDAGGGRTLNVIATHYHHLEDGGAIRVLQSKAILALWKDVPGTVLMGDLNAEPGSPEIEMLRSAGLVEAVAQAGLSPGYTYDSVAPYQRIDYVWVSPDLAGGLTDVVITSGNASDHRGVAATIGF